MNLLHVIDEIEKVDPEVFERLNGRRKAMKKFVNLSGKLALSAVPLALGSMFQKAYSQSTSQIIDVLNFALTLEYLEAEFYVTGLGSAGLIVNADRPAFQTISNHENAHVFFLRQTITALGGMPVAKPTFDYTAGNGSMTGPFTGVFKNYDLYLAVSQTFEDTGVRAYKGQATNLMSSNEILRAALQIHSTEARHASHVREIRRRRKDAGQETTPLVVGLLQPWITLNYSNIASPLVQPSYNGEELTVQASIQITGINGFPIGIEEASESFDEPLTKAQVLAIVEPFIV